MEAVNVWFTDFQWIENPLSVVISIEVKKMDSLSVLVFVIGIFSLFGVAGVIYLYSYCASQSLAFQELFALVSRTFREYYKGEDMEPVLINNGIDIVWNGDVEGIKKDNKFGFITIMSNEGSINSPIRDSKEADIIAGKVIHLVYEYIKDREEI